MLCLLGYFSTSSYLFLSYSPSVCFWLCVLGNFLEFIFQCFWWYFNFSDPIFNFWELFKKILLWLPFCSMLLSPFVCSTFSESPKSCLWGYFLLLILLPLPVPFLRGLPGLTIPLSAHHRTLGKEAALGFLCSGLSKEGALLSSEWTSWLCKSIGRISFREIQQDPPHARMWRSWFCGAVRTGVPWAPTRGHANLADWLEVRPVWLPWRVHFSERLGWGEASKIHINLTFLGQFIQFFEEEA